MEYLSLVECRRETITSSWFSPDILPEQYSQYFSIGFDPKEKLWAVLPDSYVGIVPFNIDYGIQIRPKSGLNNLTYMLYRSGLLSRSLETPFEQTVPYQIADDDIESFFEGLVNSFLESVDAIKRHGLIRQSELVSKKENVIRGKIEFREWLRDFPRTGGIPIPQAVFSPNIDNIANRVIKRCLLYLAGAQLKYVPQNQILDRLDYFGLLSNSKITSDELRDVENALEYGRFPAGRYYYLPALNLALLIFRGAGLSLGDDQDVVFKPILIDTANMFENYIRIICQDAVKSGDAHAENGRHRPLEFYKSETKNITVQPDIVVRKGGRTLFVADVKYKFEPTAQDHYQMWAYMEAYGVKLGGFISVSDDPRKSNLPLWYKRDDYSVFDFHFDCRNVRHSEQVLDKLFMTFLSFDS